MAVEKVIEALAKLASALKDNPGAEDLLSILTYAVFLAFAYFAVKMGFEKTKESRTDRVLDKIEASIEQNTLALGKVTTALERINN